MSDTTDFTEAVRLVDAIDRAVDAKAWDDAKALFTSELEGDFESLSGQPPVRITRDALVDGWAANLTPRKTSQHMRTNHVVSRDEAGLHVISAGYAFNRMEGNGEPLWEVWGTYIHHLVRTAEGWRCDAMRLEVTHQRGNTWVRDTPG